MSSFKSPLVLEPRFDPKIWGGRRLETVLGKKLPSPDRYGESLESDDVSRIVNGPNEGATIRDLLREDAAGLIGDLGVAASEPFGDFPLLAKFIDASDVLSVQVHPNDEEAASIGKRGKTEAWHVLAAEPGAQLITGLKSGVTAGQVEQAIRDVCLGDLVIEQPIAAGDTLLVPAGTTHAIGAGVLLYEIQQASDVTYRMYDWGRLDDSGNPRDLHVSESLAVLKPESQAYRIEPLDISPGRSILTACRYFALERWELSTAPLSMNFDGRSFRLLSCIQGAINLETNGHGVDLPAGQTALVAASINQLRVTGQGTLLVSYIPDIEHDVVEPLLKAGHSPDQIATLSGDLQDLHF